MTKLVLCLLSVLALSSFFMISESTAASDMTTTEAPVELLIMEEEDKLDDADVPPDSPGTDEQDQHKEGGHDTAKNKRTLESFLGYGYKDVSGGTNGIRFNRQLTEQGKVRAYFSQPTAQHAYRYYSGHAGIVPQEEYAARAQSEAQQHRPYTTIPSTNTNSADLGVPAEYFNKAAYQQQQQLSYQTAPASLLSPSLPQTAPVFTPTAHPAGPFYNLPAFASHQLFSAANPFFALGQGHNFLLPHSGSTGLALLQNPSTPYGAQIIPVIILRIGPGVEQQQHQHQSAAFLQSSPSFNLIYQQPQRPQENPSNPNQQQHIVTYQGNPKLHYIHAAQKTVYKKPAIPTQQQSTVTEKPRKNIIVVNEQPEPHSELPYTQYKYGSYKQKP